VKQTLTHIRYITGMRRFSDNPEFSIQAKSSVYDVPSIWVIIGVGVLSGYLLNITSLILSTNTKPTQDILPLKTWKLVSGQNTYVLMPSDEQKTRKIIILFFIFNQKQMLISLHKGRFCIK
jgi:hypothetical protein